MQQEKERRNEKGMELMQAILVEIFNGNVDKMYDILYKNNPHIWAYGDTNEQRVKNYCMYNYDSVFRMFMKKKNKHSFRH